MGNKGETKILAVFTLFHPDTPILINLITHCLNYSGCDVFLSDNAEFDHDILKNPRVTYHRNAGNLGLGAAQNVGLRVAIEKNYDLAILFDQDSEIAPDFLEFYIHEFQKARENNPNIIAGGPAIIDPRLENSASVSEIKPNRFHKFVIASGCMISVPELKKVGLMDEKLFIYHVDSEWCYRVRAKGYYIMKFYNVAMRHTMGEIREVKWLGKVYYHKAPLYYYFFRNSIILARQPYVSWSDKLKIVLTGRQNLKLAAKIPFLDHRWERFKGMCKGMWDGICYKV